MLQTRIQTIIKESVQVKQAILADAALIALIEEVTMVCVRAFEQDKQILFGGNGGSAADAQHLAAEFSGRFYKDRDPLNAEALHVNTSYLTAVANDYSYDQIYSRIIKAKGKTGDVLFGISTSGNSSNIVQALEQAKKQGMITIGLTGQGGGKMQAICDYTIQVPSKIPREYKKHILR